MAGEDHRLMAVALRNGRFACVFFVGRELRSWASSDQTGSPEAILGRFRKWVEEYAPDMIVSENPDEAGQKGPVLRQGLAAIAEAAQELDASNIVVARHRTKHNIYEAAAVLAELYPEIESWCPEQPPIYKSEHWHTALFEALGLAHQVLMQRNARG